MASNAAQRAALASSLWFVAVAMALHELEEWNIGSWFARNFSNHTGISNAAIWIGLVVVTLVFTGWIFVATRMRSPLAMALLAMPAVALVAVGNAVQHITWTLEFAEYAPGVASACLLVIPAAFVAMRRMVAVNRLLLLPLGGCAVLWVVASLQVLEVGRELEPFQLVLQRFFIGIAMALGLPGYANAS